MLLLDILSIVCLPLFPLIIMGRLSSESTPSKERLGYRPLTKLPS